MSKKQECYPLWVCKKIYEMKELFAFSEEEMKVLTEHRYPIEEKEAVIETCLQRLTGTGNTVRFHNFADLTKDDIKSMDFYTTILEWSRNKQVYRFDPDFLSELIETEDLSFTKDMWDYLPCKTFYIDISENKELCFQFKTQGIFVRVVKDETENGWELHTFRMVEDLKHMPYVMELKNEDCKFNWEKTGMNLRMAIMALEIGQEAMEERKMQALSLLMVPQILSYLSSVEPDIRESEQTRQTYRKPDTNAVPKNKFSEIKQEDVGVRFGTAFRKWSVAQKSSENKGEKRRSENMGHSKRPHFRKAHWQHFWYNVLDEQGKAVKDPDGKTKKVRRPKWVQAAYINERLGETDTIIHRIKKEDLER